MMQPPQTPPGWYADPHGQAPLRYWDGVQWTSAVSQPEPPGSSASTGNQVRLLTICGIWALLVIGLVLSLQSVSLLTGTSTVWTGVALAVVGAVVAFVTKRGGLATKIIAVLLVALCLTSAITDEVQLAHKQNQLNHEFGG